MALVLTGIVQGMRPVGGEFEDGPRKGEKWQFLSLEIADTRFGKVYSCQMRDGDQHYKDFVDAGKKIVTTSRPRRGVNVACYAQQITQLFPGNYSIKPLRFLFFIHCQG